SGGSEATRVRSSRIDPTILKANPAGNPCRVFIALPDLSPFPIPCSAFSSGICVTVHAGI
ncbi:hypothetical protein, partial [Faecalibaculum rodentium]|uniref:hypothetical protein n=1 Tax=Faecalibaculum rodentium TaxID=1702221 RepID=UPI003F664A32